MNTTKATARSESPNHRIASGSHAIDGSDCRPMTRLPTLRSTNELADMMSPSSVPVTTAAAKAIDRRIRLCWRAWVSDPSAMCSRSESQACPGEGSTNGSNTSSR